MGFDPDLYPWRTDLAEAVLDLRRKTPLITLYRAYYHGDHHRWWLTDKLRQMFAGLADDVGIENWCGLVVDQPVQRLNVDALDGDQAATALFVDQDLDRDQGDLYTDVYVAGEGFLVAYQGDHGIEIDVNDPTEISWPATRKRAPRVATKVWPDLVERRWRATLYYAVDVVRLAGPKLGVGSYIVPEANAFLVDEDDPGGEHGFDEVPVIRFALNRAGISRLKAVRRIQDRINKLEANKMVAAEFGAFQQRWFLTTQKLDDGAVEARPDLAVVLDPGGGTDVAPTQVGAFPATELANYDQSISAEVSKLFSVACLPRHLLVNSGTALSGDAIRADEGPFVQSVVDAQKSLGASWSDLFELLGFDATPVWQDANHQDAGIELATVKTAVDAGMPLDVALKYLANWGDEQLAELVKPDTISQIAGNLTALGTAASLGALDPAVVQQVGNKMLGGPTP